jgi:hypothetical protein
VGIFQIGPHGERGIPTKQRRVLTRSAEPSSSPSSTIPSSLEPDGSAMAWTWGVKLGPKGTDERLKAMVHAARALTCVRITAAKSAFATRSPVHRHHFLLHKRYDLEITSKWHGKAIGVAANWPTGNCTSFCPSLQGIDPMAVSAAKLFNTVVCLITLGDDASTVCTYSVHCYIRSPGWPPTKVHSVTGLRHQTMKASAEVKEETQDTLHRFFFL